jgi:hypothetical protein
VYQYVLVVMVICCNVFIPNGSISNCQGCGMKLRSDDPTSMKDFVLGIQHRVNEIKTNLSGAQDEKSKINSKRVS